MPRRSTGRPTTPQRSSTTRKSAATGSRGARSSKSMRRTKKASGSRRRIENLLPTVVQESMKLADAIRERAYPLRNTEDLDPLLERVGDARCVLLGEASHGTSEYYTWRARISERLIREKGFSFIAVEGDWPDCYKVNRYVKGYRDSGRSAREVLWTFERWPTWMWANEEILELA